MTPVKKIGLMLVIALLTACASSSIDRVVSVPSANQSERVRFLVLHFTSIDFATSLKVLTQPADDGNSVSSHYLIPEDRDPSYGDQPLRVYRLVPETARAWHAGPGKWEDRSFVNDHSIGIEMVNRSRCDEAETDATMPQGLSRKRICYFPDFSPAQLTLLVDLVRDILKRYPDITSTRIVGHADVLPEFKNDPGPRFPWQWLAMQGIGAWYDDAVVTRYWMQWRQRDVDVFVLQKALSAYGYSLPVTGHIDEQTTRVLWAFQAHFLPWEYHGSPSTATLATILALVEKYFPEKLAAVLAERQ